MSFDEISQYIALNFGHNVKLSQVSDNTLCACYQKGIIFGRTIDVPVNISVESVGPDFVELQYNGPFGVDLIIAGVLTLVKNVKPEIFSGIDLPGVHRVRVSLQEIPQTRDVCRYLALESLSVLPDALQLTATVK